MQDVASFQFVDIDSEDEAWIFIRAESGRVALGVSLKDDGDYTLAFGENECELLIEALQRAALIVKTPRN